MNPVVYKLTPKEQIPFLLVGKMVHYKDCKPSERLWQLSVYLSPKSRAIAARKLKRESADVIFIEWDVTMEQIIKQRKIVFPIGSDKVLLRDKIDITRQLLKRYRSVLGYEGK